MGLIRAAVFSALQANWSRSIERSQSIREVSRHSSLFKNKKKKGKRVWLEKRNRNAACESSGTIKRLAGYDINDLHRSVLSGREQGQSIRPRTSGPHATCRTWRHVAQIEVFAYTQARREARGVRVAFSRDRACRRDAPPIYPHFFFSFFPLCKIPTCAAR